MTGTDTLQTVGISRFRQLFSISDHIGVNEQFCIFDLRYDKCLDILNHPCRFDCFLIFFCISGNLKMMINLKEFDVVENSLFVNIPGNILKVVHIDEEEKNSLHFIVAAMTKEYMSGLKMDMGKVVKSGMLLLDNPCFILDPEEKSIAKKHLGLAWEVMRSGLVNKNECLGSLVSSAFYLAGGILEKRIKACHDKSCGNSRSKEVFDRFMGLVAEYHCTHRNVSFYAEQLCMTPKYLSKLVLSASGRHSSEWIDDYVILEAKNMLKFSDRQIKEIVSALNFPDFPSFSKFFRSRTGMTPGEYRKS